MFEVVTCGKCGKSFAPRILDNYAYRLTVKGARVWFCSWHCLRAFERDDKKPTKYDGSINVYLH